MGILEMGRMKISEPLRPLSMCGFQNPWEKLCYILIIDLKAVDNANNAPLNETELI